MADNMDKLLFSIGEEQDAKVDYDAVLAAILAKSQETEDTERAEPAHKPRPRAGWRALGAAAAFVALLGAGSLMIRGMGGAESIAQEAPAAEAPAAAPAAAAPAEARGADAPAAYDGVTADSAADMTDETFAEPAAEEAPAAEAPAAEVPEPEADEEAESGGARQDYAAGGVSGGSLESHMMDPDGMVTLGQPQEGFEALLSGAGLEVFPGEWNAAIAPGQAYVTEYGEGGHCALWNTGSAFYYIAGEGVGREELIELLKSSA